MLQRIQTVYMGLAALLTIALVLIFPLYTNLETTVMATDNPVVFFFFGFCAGGLIANIFNFKKRSLQIVLNRIIMFGFLLTLGFAITDMIGSGDAENVTFGLALLAPPIGVILVFLANKGIKKDEKLIKSADRIR
jgi:peptidoglycan/LPS O-acetylase OafA/YrhL